MKSSSVAVAVAALLTTVMSAPQSEIMDIISRESELRTFTDRLSGASYLNILEDEELYSEVTLFAPVDSAIQQFGLEKFQRLAEDDKKNYLRNFIVPSIVLPEALPSSQQSFTKKNLELFFNPTTGNDPMHFYVNEARVLRKANSRSKRVTVYLIDTVPRFDGLENRQFDALVNLEKAGENSLLRSLSLDQFTTLLKRSDVKDLFSGSTPATFFIPISDAKDLTRESLQAHVIPNRVIFTRQFEGQTFQTAAQNTTLSFANETISQSRFLVHSRTRVGRENRTVTATIHLANIPVKNGVLHIINTPLGQSTRRISDYVRDMRESYGRFNQFVETLSQSSMINTELQRMEKGTFFIPSNIAATHLPKDVWDTFKTNVTELQRLLGMHLVNNMVLNVDSLKKGVVAASTVAKVPLVLRRVPCESGCTTRLIVECGGINATVVSADIGVQNGVIHIIDRVLGAPSHSLGWKLQNTEQLSTTQIVATKNLWNKKLDDPHTQYTMFAPENAAWNIVRNELPEEYKKLVVFSNESHPQAGRIMNRHIIKGSFKRDDLLKKERLTTELNHETLRVSRQGEQLLIRWEEEGKTCRVVKSDIQATNGFIHVIDCVLMVGNDLYVSAAPQLVTRLSFVWMMAMAILFLGNH